LTIKENERGPIMKTLFGIIVLIAATPLIQGKPKERTFPANCDRVWIAVKAATAPPHYNFAQLDDAQKRGIVSTGNFATGKRFLDITLIPKAESCTVAIGGSFSGLIHNDKGDLFARIADALASLPRSPSATATESVTANSKPPDDVRQEPLTNEDILKLKSGGLSDHLIVAKIEGSPAAYRTSPDDLIRLQRAGLSDAVIGAMIRASRR
jgi:hypothetical protein